MIKSTKTGMTLPTQKAFFFVLVEKKKITVLYLFSEVKFKMYFVPIFLHLELLLLDYPGNYLPNKIFKSKYTYI